MLSYPDLRQHMVVDSLANDIESLPEKTIRIGGMDYTINQRTRGLQFQCNNINNKDKCIGMVPHWDFDTYSRVRNALDKKLGVVSVQFNKSIAKAYMEFGLRD